MSNNNFDILYCDRQQLRFAYLKNENSWFVSQSDIESICYSKVPNGAKVLNGLVPTGSYTYNPMQLISVKDAILFNRNSNRPSVNLNLLLEERGKYPVPKQAA
jgi:hypothetical protein